jgi:hypothetical protein
MRSRGRAYATALSGSLGLSSVSTCSPVPLQPIRRFPKCLCIEQHHAPGAGLASIAAQLLPGLRLHNRSAVFPNSVGSKFNPPPVKPLASPGAGIGSEADRCPVPPLFCPSVERIDMFACFAVFTIAAFDDFRFNCVFHANSWPVPCIGRRGDRTTIRTWPWDRNA